MTSITWGNPADGQGTFTKEKDTILLFALQDYTLTNGSEITIVFANQKAFTFYNEDGSTWNVKTIQREFKKILAATKNEPSGETLEGLHLLPEYEVLATVAAGSVSSDWLLLSPEDTQDVVNRLEELNEKYWQVIEELA